MDEIGTMKSKTTEGTSLWTVPEIGECKTWYCTFGNLVKSKKTPLIVLHGGPGACHECMLPLQELYHQHAIPVIFYDQIGNGRSTRLPEKAGRVEFWTVPLFVAELEHLLDHLGLSNRTFDLLGHSWGAMLGSEFAVSRPRGLRRLVLGSGPASMEVWLKGVNALRYQLPQEVQDKLDEAERDEAYQSPEYEEAIGLFYRRHLCRLEPWPAPEIRIAMEHLSEDPTVYETMYGPSELTVKGNLRTWSVIDKLPQIKAPTLLINGSLDEAQDVCMQPFFDHIRKVKWITLDGCSHFAHVEQPGRYIEVLAGFLGS